jgi:predicted regulator of Ras-like GTPase activity (Roadblock/LC7/MglB family)
MNQGLKEINELEGVWGSFICNNQAKILASALPSSLNKSNAENISRHVLGVISTGGDTIQELQEVVIYFQQRRLFILDLQQAILVVICDPSVDISLLRMTVNILTTSWESDANVQKQLIMNYEERL